jgi:hypothetical protein
MQVKPTAKKKSAVKRPASIVKKQEERIKKRGGNVVFKKDGKLPVGIY